MKLDNALFIDFLKLSLREDFDPCGDLTTEALIDNTQNKLIVCARNEGGVMSGSLFAEAVYEIIDPYIKVEFFLKDGQTFLPKDKIATIEGNSKAILKGERLFLNLLQRAISVATYTNKFVQLIKNTKAKILDTRKTTPCLRVLEKQGVIHGGGFNHRFNLSSGILIKDNHIALVGNLKRALEKAKQKAPYLSKIEIEVDSLEQVKQALEEKVDIILLDNFSIPQLKKAVELIGNSCLTEASGGVNLQTVQAIAETGVDFISVGSITQSPPPIDIGLDFV